ncbi:MAG TPA: MotA/TolQ/ExbB proton channel family protein [Arcobacter sp.]|nr:MotA/TolQ/ExbB proton channel family protein [Arcobacter sp.]HIP55963.1 MotA/TolQ/ExbB proton channel family protein [Arcobacter sp.]
MDILSFIDKGGVIVYILIALNILGFSIMILKLINIFQFKKVKQTYIDSIVKEVNASTHTLGIEYLNSLVHSKIKKLESGVNTIKIIATISPLLGLLGTVVGILSSFDTISKVGLEDPMLFSSGISIALITTVVGLIVSIPHFIFYNYYVSTLDNYELVLKDEVLKRI